MNVSNDEEHELEIELSEVTEILPKCCEFDDQINLLNEAYELVYGVSTNLLDFTNLTKIETPMENTVLHIAAWYGNNEIVNLVIERVPKLLFKFNKNNDSALHVAANGGHISTVEKLLANYANIERHDIKMAWLEYTKKNKDDQEEYDEKSNMEDLLNFVKEKNVQGNTMLHEAMLSEKSNMSRDMIFKVCELYKTEDLSGYSLANSCYEFALDIINHAKESVLFLAVVKGDKDAVKLILKNCPQNVKPGGLSPVVAAILKHKQNHGTLIIILLFNHLNDNTMSILYHAKCVIFMFVCQKCSAPY